MKSHLVFVFLILTQYTLWAQPSVLVLNTPLTGNIDTVARDAVYMNPGFSYLPSTGSTFTARIDNNLVLPALYIDQGNLPNPDSRVLDKLLRAGTLAGNYSVGGLGNASYEIPISVPPGTNGMTPQISIVYNSLNGNGILGYGWHLRGLSSIYRTGKNIFFDGISSPVSLSTNDRFELDGVRLLLFSGAYSGDNSVYRTENNPGSRITAHGLSGNGPVYFIEETKEGLNIEYGNTPDSRVDLVGSASTIAEWLINRVTDKAGNYMSYNYLCSEGEYYIRSIKYTGNGTLMAPYDSLVFRYVDRTADIVTNYLADEKYTNRKLLRNITVYSEGTELRNYDFLYSGLFYSQLVAIDQRNRLGEKCNPTIIKWGEKGSI